MPAWCRGWSPAVSIPVADSADLAFDRQLLPRRRRHFAHSRLPRRRRAARGHEPGALRLAGATGSRDPDDIVRTPGTESNVKEIYDKCAELARDPHNVILNQFSEFANYLIHYVCTGAAFEHVFTASARRQHATCRLAAFVSATGSAGTIAAGDYLKERHGTKIAAVEAIECPTHAEQRLWRAQHPGHRRQAHSADP